MDVSKAFDILDHQIRNLEKYGITGPALKCF